MEISEVTRRNIFDELRMSGIVWNGRLSEIDFLQRIFPIQEMPSNDVRFSDMAGDIQQHRINNSDWENDWIFDDTRINLLKCDDRLFLDFLCETIHPIVRANSTETEKLLEIYNAYLENDGYEICEIRKMSRRPIFNARLITVPVKFENASRINSEFVKKQIEKCSEKLKATDYDGAISSARSLVEGVMGEVFQEYTGKKLTSTGDLCRDWKEIKGLLILPEERSTRANLKSMVQSLSGLIQSIDTISNRMGDRHRPIITPERHHAKLVVDSAIAISDFLYSSIEYKSNKKNSFLNRLLEILDSNKRNFSKRQLLEDKEILELLSTSDENLRKIVKEEFFKRFKVQSYRQSDIFFAVFRIFFAILDVEDIVSIFVESQTNNQIVGWKEFEKELSKERPDLLEQAYRKIYER